LKRRPRSSDSSRLIEARPHAYDRREYASAVEAFADADRAAALSGEDLDRWAVCALLNGRDADALRILERAYAAHLEAGAALAAARSAFWIGMRLVSSGERGRGGGWLARAQRIVDDRGEECVERGYLLLPEARMRLETGDNEAARSLALEAERIGSGSTSPISSRSREASRGTRTSATPGSRRDCGCSTRRWSRRPAASSPR
jgi:hypothetical protein